MHFIGLTVISQHLLLIQGILPRPTVRLVLPQPMACQVLSCISEQDLKFCSGVWVMLSEYIRFSSQYHLFFFIVQILVDPQVVIFCT